MIILTYICPTQLASISPSPKALASVRVHTCSPCSSQIRSTTNESGNGDLRKESQHIYRHARLTATRAEAVSEQVFT